ncbi:MAG: SAM-dependent chlorinase/fluorinase [Deltaproteobacteria bacterium]|nr:SAM-dependent chlorinase/fluorinase [Deltaproteobacteria bacterium]
MAVITLLTDFGTREPWVGIMKGVILGGCPGATLVDLTHEVPPQDVRTGALLLADAYDYFPAGTIHVAVVDPGVGSARPAVAVATDGGFLVGPDNGLFSAVLETHPPRAVVRLTRARFHLPQVSPTFHGRDVFAPVAAALGRGVPLSDLGDPHGELVRRPLPRAVFTGDALRGEVLHVDAFGNLLTSVREEDLPRVGEPVVVCVGAHQIRGISRTFSDVAVAQSVAYAGSSGWLEVAVRDGNAARVLGAERGTAVVVRRG